jgi:uncharacterized membrane protein (UPF0127 family)
MIRNLTKGVVVAQRVERCATFWTRGRGLMFRRRLAQDAALLFVEGRESVLDTSIHMLFVFFAIGVIWLDKNRRVVDKTLARPFRLYYAPHRPAQYFIEGLPQILQQVEIGDQLEF